MGQIKTADIEVGAGGTEFVGTTPRQAVGTTNTEHLATLVDTGLKGFRAYKRHAAEGQAKSLLEKFTGYERQAKLLGEEDELVDRESELQETMNNVKGGTPAFALAQNEMAQVQRARDQLDMKKAAVEQGLLSFEDYRREAETLFYQQVALTPGLKDEIAGAMSEYLGIDPRGQTAAIMMEQRKAQLKEGRDTLSTMRTSMQKLGLWDKWRTEDENFQMYAPTFKKRARAMGDLDLIKKQLDVSTALSEEQKRVSGIEISKSMVEAQPQALASMGFYQQYNVNNMSTSDFLNLPEEDRLDWRRSLQAQRDTYLTLGNNFKAVLKDHFDPTPHAAAIEARFELIDGLLSGKLKEEHVAQQLKMLQDENNYSIEFEKNNILMDNEIARRFAAINELVPGEVLAKDITAANVVASLLMGRSTDLIDSADPEARENTLKTYQWTLQNMVKGWDTKKDWNDHHVKESGQIMMGITRHLPDELDHGTRQQLFAMTANKDFMDAVKRVDPRKYNIISKNMLDHQEAHNQGVTTKLERSLKANGATATADNFYLKKEDAIWMMMPTSAATETKETVRTNLRGPAGAKNAAARAQTANVKALEGVTTSMNNSRGVHWTTLIRARANILNISEAEAARQLSSELGLSIKDVTPKGDVTPERPGFGDDARREDTRSDLDKLSDESAQAVKERNAGTEPKPLPDGVYEYADGSGVFTVKNGEIVDG